MSGDATLKLLLLGQDRGAKKTLDEAGTAAEHAGGHMMSFGHLAKRAFEAFAVVEGVKAGVEFMKSSVEEATANEAAQRKLTIALHNTTHATAEQVKGSEEWLATQATTYGISKNQLLPAFQRLAESTGSVGKAQREMKIAMDVSAGTGKSLSVVSAALMKANNGTTASLSRLGLKTKDAKGHTLSLKDALAKMAETFHGQAEARARSFQGVSDRLSETMNELKISIGEHVLPVLTAMATFLLNKVMPAVQIVAEWLEQRLGPPLKMIGQWIGTYVLPMFHRFGSEAPGVVGKVGGALSGLVGAFRGLFGAIMPLIISVVSGIQQHWGQIVAYAKSFVTQVAGAFGQIVTAFQGYVHMLTPIIASVVTYIRAHWGQISGFVRTVFNQVKAIIVTVMLLVAQVIKDVTAVIGFIWKHWGNDILAVVGRIFRAIAQVIQGALSVIRGIIKVVLSVLKGDWSGAWDGIKMILSGAWRAIIAVLSLAWDAFKKIFSLGMKAVVAGMKRLPGQLVQGLGDLGGLLVHAGEALISGLIHGIGNMAGSLMSKVGSIGHDIVSHFSGLLGIHSPSRVMAELGRFIMLGLVQGIAGNTEPVKTVLVKVTALVAAENNKIKNLVSARRNIVSSVQGMGTQVMGQDFTNQTTGAKGTLSDMLAFQYKQLAQARQMQRDMAKARKMGLSRALISQFANSGATGAANLHAIATTGGKQDVAHLNALVTATNKALTSTGNSAGNALYGQAISQATRERNQGLQIERALRRLEVTGHVVLDVTADGRVLQRKLVNLKRANGGKPLGLA